MKSYIDEINGFWKLQERNNLSTGQIALWFALMHINNQYSWQEWFPVASSKLVFLTDLSRAGVYKARNVLKQKGYIDYKDGAKSSHPAQYTILPFTKDSRQVGRQVGRQDGDIAQNQWLETVTDAQEEAPDTSGNTGSSTKLESNNNNIYITNTREKEKEKVKKEKEKDDAFARFAGDDAELLAALKDFEKMRKAMKKPLTDRAKELAVKNLQELSTSRADMIEILNRSTLNCWQGLFPLPVESPERKGRTSSVRSNSGDSENTTAREWGLEYCDFSKSTS